MKKLLIVFLVLVLFIHFISCEKNNDESSKISTGYFLYQPNSDTCSNCETSYIIFTDSLSDTLPVILDCRVPSIYRVKGGVEVSVEWCLTDEIMLQFYMFADNHCGVKKVPIVKIKRFK